MGEHNGIYTAHQHGADFTGTQMQRSTPEFLRCNYETSHRQAVALSNAGSALGGSLADAADGAPTSHTRHTKPNIPTDAGFSKGVLDPAAV